MVDQIGGVEVIVVCQKCGAPVAIYSAWNLYWHAQRCSSFTPMELDRAGCRCNASPRPRDGGQCDETPDTSETWPAHPGAPSALETD